MGTGLATLHYNDFRRESSVVDERGHTRKYFFDALGNAGRIKDARGHYTLQRFDTRGNLLDHWSMKRGVGATVDPSRYAPADLTKIVSWSQY